MSEINKLEEIKNEFLEKLESGTNNLLLQEIKAFYLGKKGPVQELMLLMKELPNEEKPAFGKKVNELKTFMEAEIEKKKADILAKEVENKLKSEEVDVTLPGKSNNVASIHILNQIIDDVEQLFIGMGFEVKEGPEVEKDLYNFELLNLPKGHPAREMQDSFFFDEETLLRTHTSAVQARVMAEYGGQKPIKIICPGNCYRRDDDDATHSHQFKQIEGLVVDENINFANLKALLLEIAKRLFGEDRTIRLRPSYFPFTEPSVEVDVSCAKCGGKGCEMCKHTGFIEVLGAGIVNNNVLSMSGYDPNKYQGIAFGVGVERLAILKYKIDDIRSFYANDVRFLKEFK